MDEWVNVFEASKSFKHKGSPVGLESCEASQLNHELMRVDNLSVQGVTRVEV